MSLDSSLAAPDTMEPIRQLLRTHLAPIEEPLRAALAANRAAMEEEEERRRSAQVGPDCVSILIGSQDLLDLMGWLMPLVQGE